MGLLDRYKTSRAIDAILNAPSGSSAEAIQATLRLKQIGAAAIAPLIDSLQQAGNTAAIESVLSGLVTNTTLAPFAEALTHSDRRVVDAITRVLCQSERYDPNPLVARLEDTETPKGALGRILLARAERLEHKGVITVLSRVSSNARPVVYQLLDKIVTETDLPALLHQAKTATPAIRARLAQMVARFNTDASRSALLEMLDDSHQSVRYAALDGLGKLTIPVPIKLVVKMLRDPDITVQAKAIETVVKVRDAATVQYLLDLLQDDSEYVRRAAVEVLNEIVDQRAIKDLLTALRDRDWWVRVRAADALGKIGGPKLIEAVLTLIRDDDEFLRRTAIEILNTSKDPKAVAALLEALGDDDWWVRERAVDALIALSDQNIVTPLREKLEHESPATPMAIRALADLGDQTALESIMRYLQSDNADIRREAIRALEKLTDGAHAEQVQNAMTQLVTMGDENERRLAQASLETIAMRFTGEHQKPADNDASDETMIDLSAQTAHPQALLHADELTPGTVLADRYRIVRPVGKGGFGEVFLVEDMVVNDQLILKFLHPRFSMDDKMIERFIQELRYARKVTHENVIRIYDFITFGKSYAISMEYFPGHSLADELASKTPLDLGRAVHLALGVCAGMAAAQAVNVVHRDLKPANILINEQDALKIVDYGLAAAATAGDATATKSGLLVGTPTYMAPERARGKRTDSRADIYSLGVIMYEMLTGRPPYTGEDPMAILLQHVEGGAAAPNLANPKVPDSLSQVVLKAMALAPEERYQSFDELRGDLERAGKELG